MSPSSTACIVPAVFDRARRQAAVLAHGRHGGQGLERRIIPWAGKALRELQRAASMELTSSTKTGRRDMRWA